MRKNSMGLVGVIGLLVGCSTNEVFDPLPLIDPSTSPPAAVNEALEVEQIRKDYDICIGKLGEQDPSCQNIRWMFEDAWTRYEAAARKKP